jgi:hypothetical protein
MVVATSSGPSGATGSPPTRGHESRRETGAHLAPDRGPTTKGAPAISRVGPTLVGARGTVDSIRGPASARVRRPAKRASRARTPVPQAASASGPDPAGPASDSGMAAPMPLHHARPAPTVAMRAWARRQPGPGMRRACNSTPPQTASLIEALSRASLHRGPRHGRTTGAAPAASSIGGRIVQTALHRAAGRGRRPPRRRATCSERTRS